MVIEFQTYFDLPGLDGSVLGVDENGEFIDYNTKVALIYFSGMRQFKYQL